MTKHAISRHGTTDQAAALRSLQAVGHGSSRSGGPRFLALARAPWMEQAHLAEDLALSLARLGQRVLIVTSPERDASRRAEVRIEAVPGADELGTVARLVARGPGPAGSGLRAYVEKLSHRFDVVLVDLGTAPDDIDLLGLLPRDELIFVAQSDSEVLFKTYALIKDLCVRRRLQTLHLIVGDADDEGSARELHRALSAVAKSFIHVDIRFAGCLPRLRAWIPPVASNLDAISPLRRMPSVPALTRIATRLMEDHNKASVTWGGGNR